MIYYKSSIAYSLYEDSILNIWEDRSFNDDDRNDVKLVNDWRKNISKISTAVGVNKKNDSLSVFVYNAGEEYMELVLISRNTYPLQTTELNSFFQLNTKLVQKELGIKSICIEEPQEIIMSELFSLIQQGLNSRFIHYENGSRASTLLSYSGIEGIASNSSYKYREKISGNASLPYRRCLSKLKSILADDTLREEIKRIYDKNNKTEFCGYPVHYHICTSNSAVAKPIIEILLQALHEKKRLISLRKNIVSPVSTFCCNQTGINNAIEYAHGGTLILLLNDVDYSDDNGRYANALHETIDYFVELIREHHQNTLFLLVDAGCKKTISDFIIKRLSGIVKFIDIREGTGTLKESIAFAQTLQDKHKIIGWNPKDFSKLLTKKRYKPSEIVDIYNKYRNYLLTNKIYPSYKNINIEKVDIDNRSNSSAYEELNCLIGLDNVKKLINSIIAFAKTRSLRKNAGLSTEGISPHMVFLGNPGSAKTTVARLFARILSDEHILSDNIFVECGRADIIGKYVGYTANIVKERFKEAKGGILFIDEAYSLVDDYAGFGDEAISTIVQEMENNREDTIVIFAGYPNKMLDFLRKNEGLRSRIGFQLTFDDYTPLQLDEIMSKMAKENSYELEDDAKAVCHNLFCKAVKMTDFGNGRYVRNVLQKAILNQSNRIYAKAIQGETTKDDLMLLRAEDFTDVQETFWEYDRANTLGFSV